MYGQRGTSHPSACSFEVSPTQNKETHQAVWNQIKSEQHNGYQRRMYAKIHFKPDRGTLWGNSQLSVEVGCVLCNFPTDEWKRLVNHLSSEDTEGKPRVLLCQLFSKYRRKGIKPKRAELLKLLTNEHSMAKSFKRARRTLRERQDPDQVPSVWDQTWSEPLVLCVVNLHLQGQTQTWRVTRGKWQMKTTVVEVWSFCGRTTETQQPCSAVGPGSTTFVHSSSIRGDQAGFGTGHTRMGKFSLWLCDQWAWTELAEENETSNIFTMGGVTCQDLCEDVRVLT